MVQNHATFNKLLKKQRLKSENIYVNKYISNINNDIFQKIFTLFNALEYILSKNIHRNYLYNWNDTARPVEFE